MASEPVTVDAPFTVHAQIEARATHPAIANRVVLVHDDRQWTYREFRDRSVRMSHFLLRRLGTIDAQRPGHVAMVLDNHLEVLALLGGCAYAGLTLFGVNTGLRGEVLAGVLNQSRARVLIVGERFAPEVERVRASLQHVAPENVLVLPTMGGPIAPAQDLLARVAAEVGPGAVDPPEIEVAPDRNLMVIYTSGTTGLPKGINNNHFKLCGIGMAVSATLGIGADDRGYACMPLFHSNSIFLGLMPALWVSGSLALRERFSASQFVPDVLRYGVTYWNYVGEPVHYVLAAIAAAYGDDEARIAAEVTHHPDNRLRYALGNGAAAPDIERFTAWLGLEDMFELYGSTEAAISTFRRKGDPRGSVGEILDDTVKILHPDGTECPPAELGADGKILNYDDAVGEICRVAPDTGLFQGYFDNTTANADKYRDGVYHSGDVGHVLVRSGRRFLYFDGRTDDWIRKDGENFSAGQVGRMILEHPDVALAVAYGVPCPVSDEWVMAALKLRDGATFDPHAFYDWCEQQVSDGSMDRKWFPDFIRLVTDFEYTETQKVLVRHLKQVHFDRRKLPDAHLFWRQRGDRTFREFTAADFEALRGEFAARERSQLIER